MDSPDKSLYLNSMPKVKVACQSQLNPQETYNKVKDLIANDPGLRKLDSSYKCDFNDASMTGQAKGKQFNAEMAIRPQGGGSEVEVTVDLPLLLSPFKGQVKETLERKLNKILS